MQLQGKMIHICLYYHLDLLLICILFYDITLQLNLGANGLLQVCWIPVKIIFVFPLSFTFHCAAFIPAKVLFLSLWIWSPRLYFIPSLAFYLFSHLNSSVLTFKRYALLLLKIEVLYRKSIYFSFLHVVFLSVQFSVTLKKSLISVCAWFHIACHW